MKETTKPKEKITTKTRITDTDQKNGAKAGSPQTEAVNPGIEKDHMKDTETDQEKEETDQENKKDQDIHAQKKKKHHTRINVTIIQVPIIIIKETYTHGTIM